MPCYDCENFNVRILYNKLDCTEMKFEIAQTVQIGKTRKLKPRTQQVI